MNSDAESSTNSKAKVPTNLRFQRRQSERAFVESSYRTTPTMEYPGGSSPWASSPDASRSSFGGGDVPRDDLPAPAVQSAGSSEREAEGSFDGAGQHGEHSGGWTPDPQQQQWHQPPQPQPQQQQQQQQHHGQESTQRSALPPSEENRRPGSGRYHTVQQPAQQRQHMPQYKLQAKLTGLERTGKKDSILRFDVHVCGGNVA